MGLELVNTTWRWVSQQLREPYETLPSDEPGILSDESKDAPSKPKEESFLWKLAPFFLLSALGRTKRTLPKVSSTSYVNGLRGVACFIVFHQHIAWQVARWIQQPYGADENNYHFFQLPYIRLIHCGMFMVAVFFVLSGFVLAYSPLKKINTPSDPARDSALLRSLSSSLFRRPFRLFIPMMAAVSLNVIAVYAYPDFDRGGWRNDDPSFFQLWKKMLDLAWPAVNVYSWGYYWPLGFTHGWSLQLEYRGSIVIFVLCLLTCQLTPIMRKAALGFAAWYAMHWGRWEIFCFIEGMIIAELRISPLNLPNFAALIPSWRLENDDLEKSGGSGSLQGLLHRLPTIGWSVMLAFALLVGGWPTYGAKEAQPWKGLYAVTPKAWTSYGSSEPDPTQCFWISVGAGMLLLSLEALPRLQAIFNTTPMVYLGETSYAFYLLHQPVMFSVGSAWFRMLQAAGYSTTVCFCTEYVLVLAVLLWVADLFWRGIDEKVVNWSRAFAKWCGI
jgi:peptidoglycan/LPS O-acetylase OafA/YrhL